MAQAQCPASCGEIIQGWVLGSEKLVSCPVNWYSRVEITSGTPRSDERPLTRAMVNQLLAYWQLPPQLTRSIRIDCHSTIPVAKGMASSTADIAAAAVATARFLGHTLEISELARLCVALEPTDSTFFHGLTLFDHHTAGTQLTCTGIPPVEVLLLESPLTLTTADYHRLARQQILKENAPALETAWQKLQLACATESAALLGEAATLSALASQKIVPKPEFFTLLGLVERFGLYGISVAHSGSVAGLLLDSAKHDVEKIREVLKTRKLQAHWPQSYLLQMVAGGVE